MWLVGAQATTALASLASLAIPGPRLADSRLSGPFLLLLAGAAAVGAVAALCARYRLGAVEADLTLQITRERRAARQLDTLRGLGWTVLHDRLVPGTEHRVAHVLAGPAGIVVATVVPVSGPVRQRGDAFDRRRPADRVVRRAVVGGRTDQRRGGGASRALATTTPVRRRSSIGGRLSAYSPPWYYRPERLRFAQHPPAPGPPHRGPA